MTDFSTSRAISPRGLAPALLVALIVGVWLANSAGLISSNDGSHLALARALAVHGTTQIDRERALTLEVDLAVRDGHAYSDRPPGTAFAALAAVRVGARLDPIMRERAVAQARSGRDVDPLPGARPYLTTYAKRATPDSPRLVDLIGTAFAICCHAALVGLLGLWLLDALLRRLGHDLAARGFACVGLALASAWGPYSTALFSHVSAATAVSGLLLGLVVLRETEPHEPRRIVALATGLAGAWAIACEYTLLIAIVPAVLLAVSPRRYAWVLIGALPIAALTAAYHHAAFADVLAVGYDFQRNFAFARERDSTFSGSVVEGLWVLWGLGRGAGLLAQAPLALVGLLAGAASCRLRGEGAQLALGRALLAFGPWLLVIAAHRTPWGGGTEDHRYLIPLLPFAALGLAWSWARVSRAWRVALSLLAALSAYLVWSHFLAWHEAQAFAQPLLGLVAALLVFAILATGPLRRKLSS